MEQPEAIQWETVPTCTLLAHGLYTDNSRTRYCGMQKNENRSMLLFTSGLLRALNPSDWKG